MMRHARFLLSSALFSALLAATAHGHAQAVLGRLFSTPDERAAMEATRGASAALAPNSTGQYAAPGMPGGPPAMPIDSAPPAPPGPPQAMVSGPGTPAQAVAQASSQAVLMSGVLRRSGSADTTVWLNNQPQYGAQKNLLQRGSAATPDLTVTLPSGRRVTLKPGQRYDLNEGRVKDVNEP
jgi:hypothetical protein